ncbi:hypothetical protein [Pseudomonas sp. R1-7]|uniref:hypothetical protein n=1 Tax=Pseudomonas sp. R1-7 TaxID=2817398 RepID=UPI003DA8B88E
MAMAEIDNVAPYFYSDARERPGIVPRTQVRVAHGRLPPPANIKLLPECSHASAIAAMATFSVGLIPFKLNRLTASVDPIKYYEYRALGLPVLCTRFGEMALRDKEPGVWILDEDSDLRKTTAQALASRSDRSAVEQFREAHRWAGRFAAVDLLNGE